MSWEEIRTVVVAIIGWEVGCFLAKWSRFFFKILRSKFRESHDDSL